MRDMKIKRLVVVAFALVLSTLGALSNAVDIGPMSWVPRTDWVNVKSAPYNAKGDGSTDDTVAIQAAINQVCGKYGGTVYFPLGVYVITGTLNITTPNCNLIGCGSSTTILWQGAPGGAMVWANSADTCRYEGFIWDGGTTVNGKGGAGCAFLEFSDNITLYNRDGTLNSTCHSGYMTGIRHENESFRNFTGLSGSGAYLPTPNDFPNSNYPSGPPAAAIVSGFTNFLPKAADGTSLPPDKQPVGEVSIINCRFFNCTTAIYNPVEIFNNFEWVMDGCEFDNNGTGFNGGSGGGYILMNSHFQGSTVADILNGSLLRGLRLTSSSSAAFYSGLPNVFQDCWIDNWASPTGAIQFQSWGNAQQGSVIDCTFTNPHVATSSPVYSPYGMMQLTLSNNVAPSSSPGKGIFSRQVGAGQVDLIPAGSIGSNVTSATETFLKSTYPCTGTQVLDVTTYGADPVNGGDSTQAIQTAINDAEAAHDGAVVYIPAGVYRIKSTLNVTGNNFSIEGEGVISELWWDGGSNGTMMAVTDPQNITIRNFRLAALINSDGKGVDQFNPPATLPVTDATTIIGIKQTQTSNNASSVVYDGVFYTGCIPGNIGAGANNLTGPGLEMSGLGAAAKIYIPELDSPLTVIDCGPAQIWSRKANIQSVNVSGATQPKTGFLGLTVAEGGIGQDSLPSATNPYLFNFTINDDQNLLVGPYYSEQLVNDVDLLGGSGTTPGHVTIEGVLSSPTPVSVSVNVNQYTGRLFYAQQLLGGGFTDPNDLYPAAVQIKQSGSNPVDLVFEDDYFFGPSPTFTLDTGTNPVVALAGYGQGNAFNNYTYGSKPLSTANFNSIAQGIDDLRQLGALDLAMDYGIVNPSGLVAYWKLDEPVGPSADATMSGATGTWTGSPTFTTDHPTAIPYADSGSLALNGSNQYVDMGNPPGLPSGHAARTICGWGKASNTNGGWRWIASYGSPNGDQAMFIGMNGTSLDGGGFADDLIVSNFWDNNWHFIALTYDGTTAKLYGDGVLLASGAKNWNLVPNHCYIGQQVNGANESWNGNVDDVRIYNRVLSAAEIAQLAGTGQQVDITSAGSAIMGLSQSGNYGPSDLPYTQAGGSGAQPANVTDGNVGSTDTTFYGGSTYYDSSYIGLSGGSLASVTSSEPVTSLQLIVRHNGDGGWFGVGNQNSWTSLQASNLIAPTVQISYDGTTWTSVPSTSNYVAVLTGLTSGTTGNIVTFTLNSPAFGIAGVRLIGKHGGSAGSGLGFLDVAEINVLANPNPPPEFNLTSAGSLIMGLNNSNNYAALGLAYSQQSAGPGYNPTSLPATTWYAFPGTYDSSYVGLCGGSLASTSTTYPITSIEATFRDNYDGGWFGLNGQNPYIPLTAGNLVVPQVQVTYNGTTWVTVASASNYVAQMTGLGSPANSNVVTFTLDTPASNVQGIRLIGTHGGVAGTGDGFLYVESLNIFSDTAP